MQRRDFITATGLLSGTLLTTAATAQNSVAGLPPVHWRMSSSFGPEQPVVFDQAQIFADQVERMSAGRFTIEVHSANDLAPAADNFNKTKEGWFECAQTSLHLHAHDEAALALIGGLPFGMNPRQLTAFFAYGGGGDAINDLLLEHHLYALPFGNKGCQMGGWFRSELRGLPDLRGHKTVATGLAAKVLQRLGAVPKDSVDDVKAALKAGTLDSYAGLSPFDDEKRDLVALAPFYYYPGWLQGAQAIHLLINADVWTQLPKAYQAIVQAAAAMADQQMMAHYDAVNPPAVRRLVEAGARLKLFPQDIIDAGMTATNQLAAEISAHDASFKRLYDLYMSFCYNEYVWWQMAEYAFDNMNIRARG
jgi:TRAP-type mannitol/chloroaromatic compound transport system substrate-binding protein